MDNKILNLLRTINNKIDEHTQILRSLECASEIYKTKSSKVRENLQK